MASVQDLETRVGVLERKIDFMMSLAQVTKRAESTVMPGEYITTQMSLKDLYREISNAGELESL